METDAFAIADCMGSLAMDGGLGLWIRSVQICVDFNGPQQDGKGRAHKNPWVTIQVHQT